MTTVMEEFDAMQAKADRITKLVIYFLWVLLGGIGFGMCYEANGFNWTFAGNGLIEFGGSLWLTKSVFKLAHDKMVRGVAWESNAYWMGWGFWNIYYYPSVGDWYSFTGGLFVVAVNTFWLGQMYYYRRN